MTEEETKLILKRLVSNIELHTERKKEIMQDIKDVYSEAKSLGFNISIIKEIIKLKNQDPDKLSEKDLLLRTYASALQLDLFNE